MKDLDTNPLSPSAAEVGFARNCAPNGSVSAGGIPLGLHDRWRRRS